jgi:dolichyldiphosphatase
VVGAHPSTHMETVKRRDGMLTNSEMHGKGYGMPSSHAQFVAFFSVTLSLFLLFRHVPHPTETHTPFTFAGRLVLSLLAIASAAAVAISRIYLNYHTQKQVLVGCACGAAFALVWFGLTTYLRRAGWIEWALSTWVARAFRVRDLVVQEDLVDSGWARWEERRKRQDFRLQRKKSS